MRLIDTKTGAFVEFFDLTKVPPYAILSHTWESAPPGEQSYQEVVKIQEKYRLLLASDAEATFGPLPFPPSPLSIWDDDSGLSEKIRRACEVARQDGYHYIWIDSSCIDKASSSELSEAINSMYNWYRGAQVCYAFLSDVSTNDDIKTKCSEFRNSRWFTRGWTLQELIAPRVVVFLSREWKGLGTKDALADLIYDKTYINRGVLTHETVLSDESVANRMRWAATRETTRVEDEAYSLLGIFEITMPTLYGEGRYAFRRLQEEILRRVPAPSLFAWGSACQSIPPEPTNTFVDMSSSGSPFAYSPRLFELSLPEGKITRASGPKFESLGLPVEEYIHTPYGLRTQLCLLPARAANLEVSSITQPSSGAWYLAILASQHTNDRGRLLSKLCYVDRTKPNVNFLHVPERLQITRPGISSGHEALILSVSLDDLLDVKDTQLETRTVYLPHPKSTATERRLGDPEDRQPLRLSLSPWVGDTLRPHESTISDIKRDGGSYSFTLFNASFNIHIQYRSMLVPRGWWPAAVVIEARIWIFPPGRGENDESERDMVQRTPPYTSTAWTDQEPWEMTLPLRGIHLFTHSGDEVNLHLGLGLTAASHYNVRIEVGTTNVTSRAVPELSTRAVSKHLAMVMDSEHTSDFKLTMLGSVRRALEIREDVHGISESDLGSSHSCSLRLVTSGTDSSFAVFIKYFHVLRNMGNTQGLVVAARVTLESSSVSDSGSPVMVWKDGPYVVAWRDETQPTWRWNHERRQIRLTTPDGELLILHLGLDLAWQSEYYVFIDIERNASPSYGDQPRDSYDDLPDDLLRPDKPRSNISFTLPGQIERALKAQGYEVHFDRQTDCDHFDHYLLTPSSASLTIEIDIQYLHHLSIDLVPEEQGSNPDHLLTDLVPEEEQGSSPDRLSTDLVPEEQGSTLQACIRAFPSRSRSSGETQMLEWEPWDATDPEGWRWNLPRKRVEFTFATGQELTLCLGFYLAWFSEYCLVVEVTPKSPLPRPRLAVEPLQHALVWLNFLRRPPASPLPTESSRQIELGGRPQNRHVCPSSFSASASGCSVPLLPVVASWFSNFGRRLGVARNTPNTGTLVSLGPGEPTTTASPSLDQQRGNRPD